jgi:hypothetical protein
VGAAAGLQVLASLGVDSGLVRVHYWYCKPVPAAMRFCRGQSGAMAQSQVYVNLMHDYRATKVMFIEHRHHVTTYTRSVQSWLRCSALCLAREACIHIHVHGRYPAAGSTSWCSSLAYEHT